VTLGSWEVRADTARTVEARKVGPSPIGVLKEKNKGGGERFPLSLKTAEYLLALDHGRENKGTRRLTRAFFTCVERGKRLGMVYVSRVQGKAGGGSGMKK